jgi:hypothetical protein
MYLGVSAVPDSSMVTPLLPVIGRASRLPGATSRNLISFNVGFRPF